MMCILLAVHFRQMNLTLTNHYIQLLLLLLMSYDRVCR